VQIWEFHEKNKEQKSPQNNASVFLKGQEATHKRNTKKLDWIALLCLEYKWKNDIKQISKRCETSSLRTQ